MGQVGRFMVQAAVPLTFLVASYVMIVAGTGEWGTREALRATARIAFVLFILAFIARPLRDLWPSAFAGWLVQQRKLIGVCFAFSISIHVWLILWLFYVKAPEWPEIVTVADLYVGIPGLVFVFFMLVTSAEAVRRSLSPASWERLHTFGLYFVWAVFMLCLTESSSIKDHPFVHYWPFLLTLALAMVLRLWAGFIRRRDLPSGATL